MYIFNENVQLSRAFHTQKDRINLKNKKGIQKNEQ